MTSLNVIPATEEGCLSLFCYLYEESMKKRTVSEIKEIFVKIHGKNHYDYSMINEHNYIDTKHKLQIKCNIHRNIFFITADNHRSGKGCRLCANEKIKNFQKSKLSNDIIDKKLSERQIKRLENIIDSITPINWKCEKANCNHIWKTSPNIIAKSGCPKCAKNLKLTNYDIDYRLKKLNKNITRIGNVAGSNYKISWKCEKGHIWNASPSSIINGGRGCPKCKSSSGQIKIENILKTLNIKFITEKRFENCRSKIPLPFDFYLPDYNICIEFDGEQHFDKRYWKIFGFSIDKCEENFKQQKIRDEIKNNFCKANNIKLIRINYNQQIEEKIIESLNFIIL